MRFTKGSLRENLMHSSIFKLGMICAIFFISFGTMAFDKDPEEKRAAIISMKDATLKRLVTEHPNAEKDLLNAKGYAVFSNSGISLFVLHGGSGKGVLINNITGEQTFMKMKKTGVGLGIGFKDYRVVFIFNTENAMNLFLKDGEIASGEFDAAFASDDKGGSVTGAKETLEEVKTYQMTKNGRNKRRRMKKKKGRLK